MFWLGRLEQDGNAFLAGYLAMAIFVCVDRHRCAGRRFTAGNAVIKVKRLTSSLSG